MQSLQHGWKTWLDEFEAGYKMGNDTDTPSLKVVSRDGRSNDAYYLTSSWYQQQEYCMKRMQFNTVYRNKGIIAR